MSGEHSPKSPINQTGEDDKNKKEDEESENEKQDE